MCIPRARYHVNPSSLEAPRSLSQQSVLLINTLFLGSSPYSEVYEECTMFSVPLFIQYLREELLTEYRVEFPVLYSRSLLVTYFIYSGLYIREGNGTPLQYSCLENPMDRGAW